VAGASRNAARTIKSHKVHTIAVIGSRRLRTSPLTGRAIPGAVAISPHIAPPLPYDWSNSGYDLRRQVLHGLKNLLACHVCAPSQKGRHYRIEHVRQISRASIAIILTEDTVVDAGASCTRKLCGVPTNPAGLLLTPTQKSLRSSTRACYALRSSDDTLEVWNAKLTPRMSVTTNGPLWPHI